MVVRHWKELCVAYHFDDRVQWQYASDGVYDVSGCAIIDVDKTITRGRTLTDNWLASLYGHDEISRLSPKIDSALKELAANPWNVKGAFDEIFLGTLRGVLREQVHKDACADAVKNTAPPPYTRDMMLDLRDRGIVRGVMTFGVEDALVPWYEQKVSVRADLRGVRLIFRNGMLDDYDMGGPYGKASYAQDFVEALGFEPDQLLALDDDPVIDRTLISMLGIGFVVWIDKNGERMRQAANGLYRYPGKTSVVLEGVEKDMRLVTRYVDKWCRARFVSETRRPADIRGLSVEFGRMRRSVQMCEEDGEHFDYHVRDFIKACDRVIDKGRPFIATARSGAADLLSELKIGVHLGADRLELSKAAKDLYTLLEQQNPESRLTDDYMEELEQLCERRTRV